MSNLKIEDCLHLIRFLARGVVGAHTCRSEAISLSNEQCKEHLMLHYPVVQGMINFRNLEKLSRQSYDGKVSARVAEVLAKE